MAKLELVLLEKPFLTMTIDVGDVKKPEQQEYKTPKEIFKEEVQKNDRVN